MWALVIYKEIVQTKKKKSFFTYLDFDYFASEVV